MINGERVRMARELHGLTQTELARRVDVKQATIARIENGDLRPSDALIDAIGLHTGFPPGFFHLPSGPEFPLGSLLFRAHASTTLREKTEAYRYAQVSFEIAHTMSQRLNTPAVRLPQLSERPAIAAELSRAFFGLAPDTPIPNLLKVVENAGVLVLALPVEMEGRDAFSLWVGAEQRQPVICLSANRPGDRVRWNIAHELGHLVVHATIRGQIASAESQADAFAAEFLMPEVAMRRELVLPVSLMGVASLKPRWRVSIQALIRRAHDLEIISKRQYTYLFEQIGRRGWRTAEPESLAVPVERPRALRKMAEVLYGDPINYQKMAADLQMLPHFVKDIMDAHADRKVFGVGGTPTRRIVPLRRLT